MTAFHREHLLRRLCLWEEGRRSGADQACPATCPIACGFLVRTRNAVLLLVKTLPVCVGTSLAAGEVTHSLSSDNVKREGPRACLPCMLTLCRKTEAARGGPPRDDLNCDPNRTQNFQKRIEPRGNSGRGRDTTLLPSAEEHGPSRGRKSWYSSLTVNCPPTVRGTGKGPTKKGSLGTKFLLGWVWGAVPHSCRAF